VFAAKKKKKLFSFAKSKRTAAAKTRSARAPVILDPRDQGPFFIRGIKAGSKEEWWCSLALEKIEKETGWTWEYQYPIRGGRRRRGGNVIDFLIKTPGMWTFLDPKGRYWHTGIHEDQQEMRNIAREKKWRLIEWFTDQTPTEEAVYSFLRKELHL
jgi:hypothetical protein